MDEIIKIKPILRWAGGKNWLVKYLDTLLPTNGFKNYHEPFLGGASMFLSINPSKKSFLSDLNKDLIDTHIAIKEYPEQVINILKTFQNTEEFYYKIRGIELNDLIENAAKFIFLNQTSFNGIYRVNLQGKYNVPFGYRTKDFIEPENIRLVSLRLQNSHLFNGDFYECSRNIKKGDLIFLDPPYTVSHNNNGFIKYNQKLFSLNDQYRIKILIELIKRKEAYYILTNAAHKTILEIFEKGDRLIEMNRASLIGGLKAKRGQTSEYIFTNVTDHIK
jgi:DNA adenine methylase